MFNIRRKITTKDISLPQDKIATETADIKEVLDIRTKRLDIIKKMDEVNLSRRRESLENEKKRAEIDSLKNPKSWATPIDQLLSIARAWCIDNDKTVIGSEPAIKSLWDEDELEGIKLEILKRMKDLK